MRQFLMGVAAGSGAAVALAFVMADRGVSTGVPATPASWDERGGSQDDDGDGWPANIDCDDTNSQVHPGAAELCDGIDNDCDAQVDENPVNGQQWYFDGDQDGWGTFSNIVVACSPPPGYVAQGGDCADNNSGVHPGAMEVCDGTDNDCDGPIDENLNCNDSDGDGVTVAQGDCDDTNPAVYPGAPELCDTIDNDCDGQVDEDPNCVDQDMDGFSVGAGDCDDADPTVYPGAPELCDGSDNNCNGQVDEGLPFGDLNGDHMVNFADLNLLLSNYGASCP